MINLDWLISLVARPQYHLYTSCSTWLELLENLPSLILPPSPALMVSTDPAVRAVSVLVTQVGGAAGVSWLLVSLVTKLHTCISRSSGHICPCPCSGCYTDTPHQTRGGWTTPATLPLLLSLLSRVDHSHWARYTEILCSDWLGSCCYYASSLMP